jgi:hypothetical protein
VKHNNFSVVYVVAKATAVFVSMTTKEGHGYAPRPTDDAGQCRIIPFLQHHETWYAESERLGRLFRATRDQRHLVALARHLDAVFERLIEGSEQ